MSEIYWKVGIFSIISTSETFHLSTMYALSFIYIISLVFEAEQKNAKLQSELRKLDSDFEGELKERETVVEGLIFKLFFSLT